MGKVFYDDQVHYVSLPEDKEPVIPSDPIKDHGVRLSANMKLRMRHVGSLEHKIPVSEEWKYENGEAVPPKGRDSNTYMVPDKKEYVDYGTVNVEKDGEDETLVVTDGICIQNTNPSYTEAVPTLALDQKQLNLIKTEGRRGEVDTDPIDNENFLDRPGQEIKTSETYLGILNKEEITTKVTTEEEFKNAFTNIKSGDIIKLESNIGLSDNTIAIDSGVTTIDLNGNTLTADPDFEGQCLFQVKRGSTLILTDSTNSSVVNASIGKESLYCPVVLTQNGEPATGEPAKMVVDGGTYKGYYYAISGNGNRQDTDVTINEGEFIANPGTESVSIYQPQRGNLIINGGTFSGDAALYIKCGNVVINNGTFIGVGPEKEFKHNGNGADPTGDCVIVEACNYPGGIPTVTINGGTFTSENAKAVASYAQSGYEDSRLVKFIKGGLFNKRLDDDLIADGYKQVETNGKFVVIAE